ncbi:WAS/WASL-interacting protein family member 1-like [Canna indica]|uniref:WAS/WASL-interacting protein family member 1-like n=1 Tax=Canna indica TaxID=4628 RepID=A0AAQ3JVW0_9LILI|nr:WAS/WASL-interacting protein family member 1-like [Canna indica]
MDQSPSPSLHQAAAGPGPGKRARAPPYHAALHSVQRQPGKPWKKPDQPQPPRVYRVDPRGFRDLVQQLTGAAVSSRARPLRDTVPPPPPLRLSAQAVSPLPPPLAQPDVYGGDLSKGAVSGNQSPTGFLQGLLSPSLYSSWCSFPLLSPAEHI